ncbi:hypothetical protein KNO54_00330 [Latilactobacillus sakei]|uniref:hypothetical protein n=1 Tax=Latilactobacillus sakei TaxID=1599 RepID=UPI003EBE661F
MRTYGFVSKDDHTLIVACQSHSITFSGGVDGRFEFDDEVFNRLMWCLTIESRRCWTNFNPKEADSISSDYDSYYDKQFDNEGELNFSRNQIRAIRPYGSKVRIYKFNKRRMESFIYDVEYGLPQYKYADKENAPDLKEW